MNDPDQTTRAAPFIKSAARDIKAFRNARGYRPIPISYCATDLTKYRQLTANYLACPSGETDSSIDFFGFNVYSWCGNESYYTSGYDKLYENFQNLDIPVAVSESGCVAGKTGDQDLFAAIAAMLDPVFQAVFSGAVVYQWMLTVRSRPPPPPMACETGNVNKSSRRICTASCPTPDPRPQAFPSP